MHYFNPLWCPFPRFEPPAGTPQLLGAPGRHGTARRWGCSQPGTTVFDPRHCQAGFPRPVRLWKPCACQGSSPLAWPLLLPPLSLSSGTRSPGLALERPLGTGGRPRFRQLAHLRASCPRCQLCLGSSQPASAAYARRSFLFLGSEPWRTSFPILMLLYWMVSVGPAKD